MTSIEALVKFEAKWRWTKLGIKNLLKQWCEAKHDQECTSNPLNNITSCVVSFAQKFALVLYIND
jgi:hypothetical protein